MTDRIKIMKDEPILKAIFSLAVPTILAMLIQIIYNLTDTFFVGMLDDTNALAAMNVAFPVFMVLQLVGHVFSIGGASYVSRLLGNGKEEEANTAGAISVWSTVAFGILAAAVCIVFMDPLLYLSGASENTFDMAKSYLSIAVYGSIFVGLQITLSGLLRSEGATKQAMIGMVIGTGINIVLDPILILLLGMGVSGAAVATIIGYIIGFGYFVLQYYTGKTHIKIGFKHFKFSKKAYTEIVKIGFPSSLTMLLMTLSSLLVNNVAITYNTGLQAGAIGLGDSIIAGFGTANKVSMGVVMIVMGLAMGCQPLIGYNYGASNGKRVHQTINYAIIIGSVVSIIGAAIMGLFATEFMSVFISDAQTLELSVKILQAISFSIPFLGVQLLLMVVFQSIGEGISATIISLGRQGIFFIPALYILNSIWGINGLVWVQPFASILTTVIAVILFIRVRKKLDEGMASVDLATVTV